MPASPPNPPLAWTTHGGIGDLTEQVSLDFFRVRTVGCKVLFVLIALAHERRRVLHFNVTEHPTAPCTTQQLVEAFPWDTAPKYLLRDRDAVYRNWFQRRNTSLGAVVPFPEAVCVFGNDSLNLGSCRQR